MDVLYRHRSLGKPCPLPNPAEEHFSCLRAEVLVSAMEENLFLYEKGALVSARVVTDDLEQNFRAKVHLPRIQPYFYKVLKREIRDSKPFYYLHYIGWNERYDDWREESILSQIVPVRMGTRRSTSASNTTKNSKTRMATKKPANKRKREAESRLDVSELVLLYTSDFSG